MFLMINDCGQLLGKYIVSGVWLINTAGNGLFEGVFEGLLQELITNNADKIA